MKNKVNNKQHLHTLVIQRFIEYIDIRIKPLVARRLFEVLEVDLLALDLLAIDEPVEVQGSGKLPIILE